jgi:hypothetical protein
LNVVETGPNGRYHILVGYLKGQIQHGVDGSKRLYGMEIVNSI